MAMAMMVVAANMHNKGFGDSRRMRCSHLSLNFIFCFIIIINI
jgi:hypothetical protein